MAVSLQLQTESSFSSSFLEKLNNFVEKIHPDSFQVQPNPTKQRISHSCDLQFLKDVTFAAPPSKDSPPKPPVVPRLSLEVPRSELDEQSEALDAEIVALMSYYESWSYITGTPRIRTWEKGHPWDLKDEFIYEDPYYDEERVNREALLAYEKSLLEGEGQVDDSDGGSAAKGKPARRRPKQNPRGEATFKKPRGVRSKANAARQQQGAKSSSSDDSGEEGHSSPMRKRSFIPLGGRGRGQDKGKKKQTAADRNSNPDISKYSPTTRQPASMDPPSQSTGITSRTPGGRTYSLHRRNGAVGDASRKEGKNDDELSSSSDSDKEWFPDPVRSEEEEDSEEDVDNSAEDANDAPTKREPKGASRSYPCPECDRIFSNSSNMRKHLRIHRKEYPFGCHSCGKSFSDPSNLAKHQLSHGGERRYQCSQCPKAFFHRTSLDTHIRRHQGIRPFACLDCESSFFSRAELSTHIKIHTFANGAQRPRPQLRCTDCDKTFGGRRLLRQHQKRHKFFPCEVCNQVFTQKFKYLFHLGSHGANVFIGQLGANVSGSNPHRGPQVASTPADSGNVVRQSPDMASTPKDLTKTSSSAAVHTGGSSSVTSPQIPVNGPNKAGPKIQSKPPSIMPVSAKSSSTYPKKRRPFQPTGQTVGRAMVPVSSATTTNTWHASGSSPVTSPQIPVNGPNKAGPKIQSKPLSIMPVSSFQPIAHSVRPEVAVVPVEPLRATQTGIMDLIQTNLIQALLLHKLLLTLPNGFALLSNSYPNEGALERSIIVLDPTTPPIDATQLSSQEIVMAQKCQLCHVEYFGKHHCETSQPKPVLEMEREEPEIICLDSEEDVVVVPQPPSPNHRQTPEVRSGHQSVPHRLPQVGSKVAYGNQEEGDGSDLEDFELAWRPDQEDEEDEEDVVPIHSVETAPFHFPKLESKVSKRKRHRYRCDVCDKRFVHQRSLKQHMRLHCAFTCKRCAASFLRSEQLSLHMLRHTDGIAT